MNRQDVYTYWKPAEEAVMRYLIKSGTGQHPRLFLENLLETREMNKYYLRSHEQDYPILPKLREKLLLIAGPYGHVYLKFMIDEKKRNRGRRKHDNR